jgi:hypothetical protein
MAFVFLVPDDEEFEELSRFLKKRDKFAVDRWILEKSGGRVLSLNDEVYEGWSFLAQMWSFPDLKNEVIGFVRALR